VCFLPIFDFLPLIILIQSSYIWVDKGNENTREFLWMIIFNFWLLFVNHILSNNNKNKIIIVQENVEEMEVVTSKLSTYKKLRLRQHSYVLFYCISSVS
jgi:hypothetical protein